MYFPPSPPPTVVYVIGLTTQHGITYDHIYIRTNFSPLLQTGLQPYAYPTTGYRHGTFARHLFRAIRTGSVVSVVNIQLKIL